MTTSNPPQTPDEAAKTKLSARANSGRSAASPRGSSSPPSLTVVPRVDGTPARLEPPPDLTAAERAAFVRIVTSTDAKHFVPSDEPLLASYARAIVMEQDAAQQIRQHGAVVKGRPSPWITVQEKSHRMMAMLSLRLRLSPQARQHYAKPPERHPRPSYYEMMGMARHDDERH